MATIAARVNQMANAQATRADALSGRYDAWLLLTGAALLAFGTVMVASASFPEAVDNGLTPFYFLLKHLMFLAAGSTLAWALMRTELKTIDQHSRWVPLLCMGLLLLVALPGLGVTVKGARRWINLGVMRFQPVEAVKLLMIVWLASYMVRFRDDVNGTWKAMLKPLGVALLLGAILLVVQKDFGSTALILAITSLMLIVGGAHLPRMFVPAVLMLPVLALMILMEPYRMRRLVAYLNPWEDPLGSGYQLTNALMAIGRGEFWGVGLGGSVQKLSYLPEAHTDFIMAVISEELGFVGVCAVISMYALLVGRAFVIGLKCVDMNRFFAGFCALGIGIWIALQAFISIGVNLGLLPTKGLTLPFISSGGSSLIITCAALGLLLRVSYEQDRAERQVAVRRPAAMPVSTAPESVRPVTDAPKPQSSARPRTARPTTSRVQPQPATETAASAREAVSDLRTATEDVRAAMSHSVSRFLRRDASAPSAQPRRIEPVMERVERE